MSPIYQGLKPTISEYVTHHSFRSAHNTKGTMGYGSDTWGLCHAW